MEHIDLSGFAKTKGQAREFSIRLASITDQVFKVDFELERAISEQLGIQKKDLFMALLRNNHVVTEKPSAVKDFLMNLQNQLNSLPVLSLSVAVEPTEKTLKILSDWFLMNLKRQVLFDIAVDPSLIAGIAIHFNGRFLDFTIRDRVNTVITSMLESQASPAAPVQSAVPTSHTQPVHVPQGAH